MSTATPPLPRGAEPQTPCCTNCGFEGALKKDTWCPQCGYYPKLGRCVDLGADAHPQEESIEPLEIPGWCWVTLAGSVGIAVLSLLARFNVPDDGPRTIWSLCQFLIGLAVLLAAHLRAYVAAAFRDSDLTPLDMILRPYHLWSQNFDVLPEGNVRIRVAVWGMTAALSAMFLVGGMSYARIDAMIVEFLPEPPTEAAVVQSPVEEVVEEKLQMTCVVIGYTRSVAGATRSLLVADMLDGLPRQFIGKINDEDIDESVLVHVDVLIPRLARPRGTVACPIRAYWLEPEVVVVVEYDELDEEGLLVGARIISLVVSEDEEVEDQAGAELPTGEDPDGGDDLQEVSDSSSTGDEVQGTSSSSSSSSS